MEFWDFGRSPRSSTLSSYNQVMEIVSKYEPDPELVAKRAIGKEGFTRFQTTRMIVMMMSRMVEIYNDGDYQMLTIVYIVDD